jgi:hypothetical protein
MGVDFGASRQRSATDKLTTLQLRRHVTAAQAAAGRMWRGDWLEGQTGLRARGFAVRQVRSGEVGLDLRAVARQRFRQAAARLGAVREICHAVVIEERDTAVVARELGENGRAILPMVRRGLAVLAEFYEVEDAAARNGAEVVDDCAVDC